MHTYRRRYEWMTRTLPAQIDEAGSPDQADPEAQKNFLSRLPPIAGEEAEPFRAKILVNPTGADIRAEQEAWNALKENRITEDDYLEVIAERVREWNFEVEDRAGNIVPIAAPGSPEAIDNPERINAFLELEPEDLGWLLIMVRYAHLPKAITRRPEQRSTTDSSTPPENQTEASPAPPSDSPRPSGTA